MNYTTREVAKHNTLESCWIIAHNKVYDVTHYINSHPGGTHALLKNAGSNQTNSYDFHTPEGKKIWEQYCIGYINKRNDCCVIS